MFEYKFKNGRKFLADEKGATMVEYALLAALIGVAGIGAVTNVGQQGTRVFEEVRHKMAASTGVIPPEDGPIPTR